MTTNDSQALGSYLFGKKAVSGIERIANFFDRLTPYSSEAMARREFAGQKLQKAMEKAREQKLKALSDLGVSGPGFVDLMHLYDARDRVLVFPMPQGTLSRTAVKHWAEVCANSVPGDFPYAWGVGSVAIRTAVGDPANLHPQTEELMDAFAKSAVMTGIDAEPDGFGVVRLPRFGTDNSGKIRKWTLGVMGVEDGSAFQPLGNRSLVVGVDPLVYSTLVAKNASNRFDITSEHGRQTDFDSSLLLTEVKTVEGYGLPLYSYSKIK